MSIATAASTNEGGTAMEQQSGRNHDSADSREPTATATASSPLVKREFDRDRDREPTLTPKAPPSIESGAASTANPSSAEVLWWHSNYRRTARQGMKDNAQSWDSWRFTRDRAAESSEKSAVKIARSDGKEDEPKTNGDGKANEGAVVVESGAEDEEGHKASESDATDEDQSDDRDDEEEHEGSQSEGDDPSAGRSAAGSSKAQPSSKLTSKAAVKPAEPFRRSASPAAWLLGAIGAAGKGIASHYCPGPVPRSSRALERRKQSVNRILDSDSESDSNDRDERHNRTRNAKSERREEFSKSNASDLSDGGESAAKPSLRRESKTASLLLSDSDSDSSSGSNTDSDSDSADVPGKAALTDSQAADAEVELAADQAEGEIESAADRAEGELERAADAAEDDLGSDGDGEKTEKPEKPVDSKPVGSKKANAKSSSPVQFVTESSKSQPKSLPGDAAEPSGRKASITHSGKKRHATAMDWLKAISAILVFHVALYAGNWLLVSQTDLHNPSFLEPWMLSTKDAITTPMGLTASYVPGCLVVAPVCRDPEAAGLQRFVKDNATANSTRAVFFETQPVLFGMWTGNATATGTKDGCAAAAEKYHRLCNNSMSEPILTRFYDGDEPLCEYPNQSANATAMLELRGLCSGNAECERVSGLIDECARRLHVPHPFTANGHALTPSDAEVFGQCMAVMSEEAQWNSRFAELYTASHPRKCVPSAGLRLQVNATDSTYQLIDKPTPTP